MLDKGKKEKVIHGDILFNLAVHFTRHNKASDIMLYTHWHSEIELLYIAEGSMMLQIDSHSLLVKEGDVVLIPPNLLHGGVCWEDSPCDFYAIVFHPDFISSSINDSIQQKYIKPYLINSGKDFYFFDHLVEEDGQIMNQIHSIICAYEEKEFGYELMIKVYLLQVLHCFIAANHRTARVSKVNDPLATARIKKILFFLEENYQQGITLSDWANSVALSKEQFNRIFKKYFLKTPMEYLLHYRISKASELLLTSDLPIIDIAFETGFESGNYFTIAFKNIMKITPREFRKRK